jgi:hypothetical protein
MFHIYMDMLYFDQEIHDKDRKELCKCKVWVQCNRLAILIFFTNNPQQYVYNDFGINHCDLMYSSNSNRLFWNYGGVLQDIDDHLCQANLFWRNGNPFYWDFFFLC